jgi:hypothetical protein
MAFPKKRQRTRRLFAEALEARALMAGDVAHNFVMPHDVDDDGALTPLDALIVINDLNRNDDSPETKRQFHDVDDDSSVTPLDALILINAINSQPSVKSSSPGQAASISNPANSVRVRVELESQPPETELDIRVDQAPVSSAFDVTLNNIALGQLVTDARGRGRLVLSQGDDNSNHVPLPSSLTTLSPDMELVIGDIVKAKLSNLSKVEDRTKPTSPATPGAPASTSLNLIAKFDVVGGIRSAEFEQETERGITKRKFKAEIEKAAPNTSFDVKIEEVVVGKIVTDSKGKGKLILMPTSFPVVAVGTKVSIGSVSSTFQKAV